MAIDKIFNDANVDGIADNIFGAVNNSVSEVKQMQQRKAAENVQMVVEAFKKIETNITEKFDNVTDVIEKRVLTIKDGRDGSSGSDGRNGRDGKPGRDGVNGKQGTPGTPGKDGTDGVDGVSVTDASIDFDGSLVISLSSGQQINVGEVVPAELERQLVELRQGGGSAGSSGDVAGPTSSTDNAIVRFDGTTGKLVQNSVVTIADTTGNMAGVGTLGVGAITTTGALVGAATQSVFNTVSTTLNLGGAATAVNIGAATGTLTVANTTLAAKRITASTTLAVTGVSTLTAGAVIEGMTVGLGSGAVATNTAVGFRALLANINGIFNSASGYEALRYNTTGSSNTATGTYALNSNSNGSGNTASGATTLQYNTLGDNNVATGTSALQYNTSGSFNTAAGYEALRNTTGSRSTAIGWQALVSYTPPVVTAGAFVIATAYTIVTVGTTNFVAIGASANTVGVVFTATGAGSGTGTASTNVDATNTALGYGAGSTITTGIKNTIIGAYSGNQGGLDIRTASNHIVLSDGDGNPRGYFNASGVLTLSSALPVASGGTGIASFGTGVATALGVNVGTAGAFVVNGGALGSPSSVGTMPAFTLGGTVSGGGNQINNVVIGTTTPLAGAFTTLSATGTITHSLSSDAYDTGLQLTNTSAGTSASTALQITNNAGSVAVVRNYGSGFTTTSFQIADSMLLYNNGAGGVVVSALSLKYYYGTSLVGSFSSTALALGVGISLTGGTSGTGYSFSGTAPAGSLTLDSSGNLGIGTSSPGGLLQVGVPNTATGSLRAYSGFVSIDAGYQSSNVSGTAAAPSLIWLGDDNTGIWHPASDTLAISTAGTERVRIDSSGNLLVGTTSAFSASGISPKVTISNTAGIGLIAIGNADAGLVTQPAANTNYYAGFFLNSSSTGVGNIFCTGSLTVYNTTSDYRLKTAISSVTGHGERIDSLKPIDYQWKRDNSQARGFLAHEFKTVYPNSVSGDKDAVDADGKPMYQSMQASTSEVIADLVAELQSLRARVAQLESKP